MKVGEFMTDDKKRAPYCNTGSMDTGVEPLRSLVDWLSVTFLEMQNWENVASLIGIGSREFFVQNKGFNGYQNTATFGSITIAFNETKNNGMGVHLNMNGQACREYESLFDYDLNWSLFFRTLLKARHNVTRLDLAIDDFKGYFTVEQAINVAKKGNMTASRVKKARRMEEFLIENGKTDGITFYVGKSDWMIRFYDKLAERKNKKHDVTVDFWNRYEIQLRGKVATDVLNYLAYEQTEIGQFIKGFLKSKIDFKIKSKTDSNKSRWKSKKWWADFLEDVEKVEFSQSAPDMTIEKKYKWIDKQVARSFYMLTEAFPDDEQLVEYLKAKGKENITRVHIKEIEDFKNSFISKELSDSIDSYLDQNKKTFLASLQSKGLNDY